MLLKTAGKIILVSYLVVESLVECFPCTSVESRIKSDKLGYLADDISKQSIGFFPLIL